MKPTSANSFVSADSPETKRRQAGDVSPVSLPRRGRDRDNRRDWTQPITVKGSELAQAIAEAHAAGYHGHLMKLRPMAMYQLKFFRLPSAPEAGKQFRESPFKSDPCKAPEQSLQSL
jgi:hypothetical protein